jgi:type II secretory pathway component PulK
MIVDDTESRFVTGVFRFSGSEERLTRDPFPRGDFGGGAADSLVTVYIEDLQARLNVNYATEEELRRIPGLTSQTAAAVADWRDADDSPRLGGAESDYYRSLIPPYKCKNHAFESVDELLLVKSVDPEIYLQISEFVTTYGEGRVNINTCPVEVLTSLGLDNTLSRRMIDARNGSDGVSGTGDDVFFTVPDSILPQLRRHMLLNSEEVRQIADLLKADRLCTNSTYFRVRSVGQSGRRSVRVTITAVLEVTEADKFRTVYWHER